MWKKLLFLCGVTCFLKLVLPSWMHSVLGVFFLNYEKLWNACRDSIFINVCQSLSKFVIHERLWMRSVEVRGSHRTHRLRVHRESHLLTHHGHQIYDDNQRPKRFWLLGVSGGSPPRKRWFVAEISGRANTLLVLIHDVDSFRSLRTLCGNAYVAPGHE